MKREREEHSGSTTDGKKARPHADDENGAKALASEQKPAPVVGEYDEDDDQPVSTLLKGSASGRVRQGHECPYLDSINRQLLDFDFEKCCSETLSHVNIYACLVCGKYYQGRAPKTVAFTHALESGHHMFMKLEDKKVYCLPDNYEVVDRSLDDIRHNLDPQFSAAEISGLDREVRWARALDGTEYQPGLVGLNNMKNTDYINVCLQMLLRISPVRDFFLRRENYAKVPSELVQRFGQLMRKVWNLRNFKGQVSPHELMQAIISESKKRFTIEQQSDPVEVWSWLLHTLHLHLTGGKPKKKSIITFCFQGQLEVTTEKYTGKARESSTDVVEKTTFLMLSMELPPMPLYKDAMERNFIPQVPIFNILTKYDGTTVTEDIKLGRRRFRILQLPRFLVLHPRRFTKNNFFVEKNKTIVNFPVKNLLLSECISVPKDASGRDRPSKYDLVANLVHQGENRNSGTYKVHIHRKSEDIWYEVQDLHIVDVLPQMVALSETFLQVYELKDDPPAQPAA